MTFFRPRTRRRLASAASVMCAALILGGCSGGGPTAVTIRMHYSKFLPSALTVAAGTTVTFTLVNADTIAHELIIGDEATQQRHERGTETSHDGVPGQASLDPGETQTISYRFDAPGTLLYGCHRPGHYAYGMRGTVRVTG